MSDLPCNLNLFLQASFGQEEVQFRTDVLLPQPILLAPIDNAHICLTANRNSTSHIALAWTAVTGATNYVLQWGDSEDMSSPSLRQEILSTTAFTLFRNRDIRLGQTIYWRVFAINLSGGVSLPSATRQLTYICPEGKEANKESTFNVEAELLGPDTIRSCEDTTYYIKLSFTSRDANFREIARYIGVDWSVEFVGSASGNVELIAEGDNDLKRYVNVRNVVDSGNIKLVAEIQFLDLLANEPFTKSISKEIVAEPFTYGCGLTCAEECFDSEGEVKTWKVAVDLEAIAGPGLFVIDPKNPPPGCPVDPCGCKQLTIFPPVPCTTTTREPVCEGLCLWTWNDTTKLWETTSDECTEEVNCGLEFFNSDSNTGGSFLDFDVIDISNLTRIPNFPYRPGDRIQVIFSATNTSMSPMADQLGIVNFSWTEAALAAGLRFVDATPSSYFQPSENVIKWSEGFGVDQAREYSVTFSLPTDCESLEELADAVDFFRIDSDVEEAFIQTSITVYSDDLPPGTNGDCRCDYPSFCGEFEGQQNFSFCTPYVPIPPNCGQTTESPCDCSTTTTLEGCVGGCKWVWPPTGIDWVLVESNCLSQCPCEKPSSPGSECGTTLITPCGVLPENCSGFDPGTCIVRAPCIWLWIPDGLGSGYWQKISQGSCVGACANCAYPSIPASDPDDICATVVTPCSSNRGTDDPCCHCYTTTLDPGTSTPAPDPCESMGCTWQWVKSGGTSECIGYWVNSNDDCPAECPCAAPSFDLPFGATNCSATVKTRCGTGSPPTTIPPTTTPPPPTGKCCIPDNPSCSVTTEADCAGIWTSGANCSGEWPCGTPPDIGACCPPSGSCFSSNQADCLAVSGVWLQGSPCSESECWGGECPPGQEDVVGACCLPDTGCTLITCSACAAAGGSWYFGKTCADIACPPTTTTSTTTTTTTAAPTTTTTTTTTTTSTTAAPSGPSGPSEPPPP